MDKNKSTSTGIGFTGLLTIAFIVLKLCHIINWSWVWVLSPIWISLGLGIIVLLVIIVIDDVIKTRDRKKREQRNK